MISVAPAACSRKKGWSSPCRRRRFCRTRGSPWSRTPTATSSSSTSAPDMDKINPVFTASATATGGRNGRTESSDGMVKVDLSVPKELGGPGKPNTATPEHLFAAGYAACFGGALDFVGKQHKKDATRARITSAVSIGPREAGGFGISVRMRVED